MMAVKVDYTFNRVHYHPLRNFLWLHHRQAHYQFRDADEEDEITINCSNYLFEIAFAFVCGHGKGATRRG